MKRLIVAAVLLAAVTLPAPAAAASPTLILRWSALTSSIRAGTYATATVQTTVGAKCGIVVRYASTTSKAAGLITKTAPAGGRLSWRWKTGTNTTAGSWRVTVTCKLGTRTLSIWRTMTIL
jgi:hypothetical protein